MATTPAPSWPRSRAGSILTTSSGVHVNQIFSFPSGDPKELEGLTPEELGYLSFLQGFVERAVHDKLQAAQPQTIAHALADSPAGQIG